MLDENLPTFVFRQSSDDPQTKLLYFTANGSEPAPEYYFKKLNPAAPEAKNRYAGALGDASAHDIIFGEVLIEPEFQQPSLSAAEIRAQNGVPPPPTPMIPDSFSIQLYNPEQVITVRGEKSTWTGKESWDFEMPQHSFRMPSTSAVDRQHSDPTTSSLTPKSMFKWKRDSKFSKDMTCYMTGTSVGGKQKKEPDITIALYKQAKDRHAITVYEPNLQRVEVEDRKGFEVVLLLAAEVIREIYLFPNRDSFNISSTGRQRARTNSRPLPGSSSSPRPDPYMMSSAVGNLPPGKSGPPATQQQPTPPGESRSQAVEQETQRLQAMVQQEQRQREQQEQEEQKRIKQMLEDEEQKEKQRRNAEVDMETERLRREFGLEGQDLPSAPNPSLPPRPAPGQPSPQNLHTPHVHFQGVQPPPRPLSADPRPPGGGFGRLFHNSPAPPNAGPSSSRPGRRRESAGEGGKVRKKKSGFF